MGPQGEGAWLLSPPEEADSAAYHEQLLARRSPPLPVCVRLDAGGGKGKGVFATRDIEEGELIFAERPLAGVQHVANKADLPACANCFRALVTPERAVADILCAAIGRLSGDAGRHGHDSSDGSGSSGCAGSEEGEEFDPAEAARRAALIEAAVDAPTLEGFINGTRRLPRSELVETPDKVPCLGGCDEVFCSEACARAAWDSQHCLLCPVGRRRDGGGDASTSGGGGGGGGSADAKGKGKASGKGAGGSSGGGGGIRASYRGASGSGSGGGGKGGRARAGADAEETVAGGRLRRARLAAFLEHADETNDSLRLAAQVLAMTLVKAEAELRALRSGAAAASSGSEAGPGSPEAGAPGDAAPPAGAPEAGAAEPRLRRAALRRAWMPFAVAQKAPYWEVLSVDPEDDPEEEMTGESLRLLRAAWVYASILGMFEQNNLAINLPSPAAAYLALPRNEAALPDAAERAALELELEPLRLALGDDLHSLAVEGTAFFALQSCCNHSCAPSAAAEGDPCGEARLVAARRIAAGEEVTISYVEEEGVGLEERRAALAAYGFECRCGRCEADALAAGVAVL
ncbi:hypothetical protein Rsub_01844 [Raphidocelis subcapitata]|uniref:SET domain-containing protein n=1 Tax=Raphidocelis subcapitata TaxID=307507 RepID=A0A2V0NW10_9CHLO|nr:hypothetical protein Rsub_01844 [Raphidocelis subcapitata]|eukprot:GBF89127.1 hypothetical protein Rsub_01844 [Raphidocelis subcapitata]